MGPAEFTGVSVQPLGGRALRERHPHGGERVLLLPLMFAACCCLPPAAEAQQEGAATTQPAAPPPVPGVRLDHLLDELSTFAPQVLQAHVAKLREQHKTAIDEAAGLRSKAQVLEARAALIQQRIDLLGVLLQGGKVPGAAKPVSQADPSPAPGMAAAPPHAAPSPATAEQVTYEQHVEPILVERCAGCHNPDKSRNDLIVDSYDMLIRGGSSGKAIIPGDPAGSLLWRLVDHQQQPHMPWKEPKLPDDKLQVVRRWIAQGALRAASPEPAKAAMQAPQRLDGAEVQQIPSRQVELPATAPQPPAPPGGRTGAVTALAASAAAPLFAAPGYLQIQLYDLDTQQRLAVLPFDEGRLNHLEFSADGEWLIAAGGRMGQEGRLVIFEVASGQRLAEVGRHYDAVLSAAVDPYRELVAVGGSNRRVRVYDVYAGGEQVYEVHGHNDWISALAFSPDATLLATGDRAGGLLVSEAETGRLVHILRGHEGAIHDVAFRPDSAVLASAGEDGSVRLWDTDEGRNIKLIRAHDEAVLALDFDAQGRLCTSSADGAVKLWNSNGEAPTELHDLGDWVYEVCFASGGGQVLAGTWTGEVYALDADSGAAVWQLHPAGE